MKKKPTLSKLKREADRVFSLWIRARDKHCVICGSKENLTNGHLISRRIMSLRWSLLNCATQCWPCNFRHRYHPHIYTAWFINEYGLSKYSELIEESKQLKQWKRHELEQIIEKYK